MMERASILRRSMDKVEKILLLLLFASTHAYAQQTLVTTIKISDVQSAYVDRPGDLYVLQKKNIIKKFDIQGTLVDELKFQDKLTAFDPRDGARLFACLGEKCSYFSGETKQELVLEKEFVIEPSLICSSGDHNLWVLDKADFSLKKISPSESKVLAEVILDPDLFKKKPEIQFMREYQNFLFILDKNIGIIVFNGIGKQVRIISEPNLAYFNFLGREIYIKKDNKLVFYDLFDTTTREEPIDPTCKYALITDVRKYLIYETKIDIFENR
jgi:hypothetical protein